MPIGTTTPGSDFTDAVKRKARELAFFKCCYCFERQGHEVHHLIPKEEGGTGELDNAILLCVQCHSDFGHRSDKRQQLRQARNHWYEIAAKRYGTPQLEQLAKLDELATKGDVQALMLKFDEMSNVLRNSVAVGTTTSPEIANVVSTMVNSIAPTPAFARWAQGVWAPGLWQDYCGACKSKLPSNAAFCPSCGIRVGST